MELHVAKLAHTNTTAICYLKKKTATARSGGQLYQLILQI